MPDRSSTPVLLGRVALLAIAAAAAATSFAVWRGAAGAPPAAPEAARAVYVCPMHANVTSASPGDCPICRMALVLRAAAELPADESKGAADRRNGPPTLTLPPGKELRGYDGLSRAKRFESAFEMRVPAAADGPRRGVALYHVDESALIRAGEEGLFSPASGPRAGAPLGIKVRVREGPRPRWDESTVLVPFEAEPGADDLVPNETGLLKLATRLRNDLVVAESSIIQSPDGPYVLVAKADRRTLTRRPVEIGTTLYGYAAVTGGLREDEHVAATHTFVLDADRRAQRPGQ
jgi:hypothetical protein